MAGTEARALSKDGSTIGFIKIGSGPSLVIVHGSLTTGNEWLPVANALSGRFTCFLLDRRGRGRSGDSAHYSLAAECEDIEAVLNQAGAGASLLGHSYGAICALETARRHPVSRLVLYEPPLPIHAPVIGPAFEEFKAAVKRGDHDEALTIGFRDLIKMPDAELAALRGSLMWRSMAALTPTWVRECEVMARLDLGVARFATVSSPVLLLLGTATASHHIEASRALMQTLPNARLVELEGQSHQAHLTATRQVATAIADFLSPPISP